MIPSHTKVAWAFLDKLLGRTPPPPDTDPRTLSMDERNEILDRVVVNMGNSMNKAMEVASSSFAKQVIKMSRAQGVDPRAVFHRLVMPRKKWPMLPPKTHRWLDTMASIISVFGDVPSVGRFVSPPELEPSIRIVLENLGNWAATYMKDFLEKAYLEVLQKEARQLIPVYSYPDEPVPSLPKVTLALMHEFEWRLDHARLPIGGANLMERVFRLFT